MQCIASAGERVLRWAPTALRELIQRLALMRKWAGFAASALVACSVLLIGVLTTPASSQTATLYTYDEAGRLVGVTYPGDDTIKFRYDAAGNRIAIDGAPAGGGAPKANADTGSTQSNSPITIDPRVNDTDPLGGVLTITGVANAVHGTAVVNSGASVTFTPTSNFVGTASYQYTITNPQTLSATGAVTITVENRPPTAIADVMSAAIVATTFDPRSNDSDPEGGGLTITGVSAAIGGSVAIAGGGTGVTFTPTAGYTGVSGFTYTVTDAHGASASGGVTVRRAPIAVADSVSTLSSSAVTFDPRGNDADPEGGALTITGVTGATNGTAAVNSGTSVTFTPTTNFIGAGAYSYTITDPTGATSSATVSVTVQNRAPVANADSASTISGFPVTFDPRSNDADPEGSALTIIGVSNLSNGTATVNNGANITFTPSAGFVGSAGLTYTVQDANGGQSNGTVSISVTPVDYTPNALDWANVSAAWNGTSSGSPTPEWADTGTLTISGLTPGASIVLSFNKDQVSNGTAGLKVEVYKNGVYATAAMYVAPAAGGTGPSVGTVTVTNGDTIRFRMHVFDPAVTVGSGTASERAARQLVYNQTTSTQLDTFNVYGMYTEADGGCPPGEAC